MQIISKWQPGICRGRVVSINHPAGPEFCEKCQHYTILDYLRKCECCQTKVTRRRTFHAEVKVFDNIIKQNQNIIDSFIANPYKSENMPGFAIKIGYRTFLVSIEHLANYTKIPNTRNPEKISPFFAKVRTECLQLMPGTTVR